MFLEILHSLKEYKKSWSKYLTFSLIWMLFTSYIFIPILSYLFNRFLVYSGSGVLLDRNVFRILLDYRSALGLLLILIIAVLAIFIQLGTLIIISQRKHFKKEITISDALITTFYSIKKTIGFGSILLIFIVMIFAPIVEMPGERILSGQIKLPEIILNDIMSTLYGKIAYWTVIAVFSYLLLRWIFTMHIILLENKTIKYAMKKSSELTKKRRILILFKLFLFNIILVVLGFGIMAGISKAMQFANLYNSHLIDEIIVTMSGIFTAIYTLVFIPINVIFLTRMYYSERERKKDEINKESIKIHSIKWVKKIENKIENVFDKSKYLIIIFFVAVVVISGYIGYFINQDFIYLGRDVLVAAHRGDATNAPENSLSAIESAVEKGADAIEFDVQMTADEEIILFHDVTLSRIANSSSRITSLTYEKILDFDIGKYFSEEYKEERIPTLKEAFEIIPEDIIKIIDVKVFGVDIENFSKKLVDIIENKEIIESSYVQSSIYEFTTEVKKLNSSIKIGQVMFYSVGDISRLDVDFYTVQKGMLNENIVKKIKEMDREIWVWTVNTKEDAKEVFQYDIDGIITKDVELIKDMLSVGEDDLLEIEE